MERTHNITLTTDADYKTGIVSLFTERVLHDQLSFRSFRSWTFDTNNIKVPSTWKVLSQEIYNKNFYSLFYIEDALVKISTGGGVVEVLIAQKSPNNVDDLFNEIKKAFPESLPSEGRRPLTFWNNGSNGAKSRTRQLAVPTWKEIRENYSNDVKQKLSKMMNPEFRPSSAGQLILWRGSPGTGKTWAIRSMMWEWRKWAEFHYITDPDSFFGSDANYMMTTLLSDETYAPILEEDVVVPDTGKWRILLLEDCGELLATDAKTNVGQGLSRLLNVVDGLIGQGLRILVLVTTNEELGKLHPAISRPGRCLVNVEFENLGPYDAGQWFAVRGLPVPDERKKWRLADLYATINGQELEQETVFGFNGKVKE